MKLQIISDIHIETYNKDDVPKIEKVEGSEMLCLLGDIGIPSQKKYRNFIKEQSKCFKYVIVIAGNHEYYGITIDLGNKLIEDLCDTLGNVYFLNNRSIVIDGIRYIGSTLWSNIPYEYYNEVMSYIADFERIRRHRISDTNRMHKEAIEFIRKEIEIGKENKEKCVILTHHAPIKNSSAPQYVNKVTNCAYATSLEYLFEKEECVKLWCFGHTHWCIDIMINDTRVISNCYGYDGEETNGFNAKIYLKV